MTFDYDRIDTLIEELFADAKTSYGKVCVAKLFAHLSMQLDQNLQFWISDEAGGDEE